MTDRQHIQAAQRALTAARLDLIEATNDLAYYREKCNRLRALIADDGSETGSAYLAELDDVVAHLEADVATYRTTRDAKAAALDALTRPSPFQAVGYYRP